MSDAGVRRLLLIQPRWLGDVLLCTPAVRAARCALPHAHIAFLTEPAGAAALEDNPDLDEIIVARRGRRGGLLKRVRDERFDAVVDFRSTGSTALVTAASGATIRVGTRGTGLRNLAYTVLLPRERRPIYMARQKIDMLAPIGITAPGADLALRIAIGPAQRRRATDILAHAGMADGRPIVAVSAVSRVPDKQWGAEHWAAVADRLAEAGAHVLLSSGPGEAEQVHRVAELMGHRAAFDYGATTIRELAALYERCALWIGNDGGPKHVAVAAGTPTLTASRHGISAVWTEPDSAHHQVLEAGPPDSCAPPCSRCGTGRCFGPLEEHAVADAALAMFNTT